MGKNQNIVPEVDPRSDENDNTLNIDREKHSVHLNGNTVPMTASEWKILLELITHSGSLISRSYLLSICFDAHAGYERIVDTHIKNIRAKIGKRWIETVRGYGYKFNGRRIPTLA